jgi:hypothetical protein
MYFEYSISTFKVNDLQKLKPEERTKIRAAHDCAAIQKGGKLCDKHTFDIDGEFYDAYLYAFLAKQPGTQNVLFESLGVGNNKPTYDKNCFKVKSFVIEAAEFVGKDPTWLRTKVLTAAPFGRAQSHGQDFNGCKCYFWLSYDKSKPVPPSAPVASPAPAVIKPAEFLKDDEPEYTASDDN